MKDLIVLKDLFLKNWLKNILPFLIATPVLFSCAKKSSSGVGPVNTNLAVVESTGPWNLTPFSAEVGGIILDDRDFSLIEVGVVWDTIEDPDINVSNKVIGNLADTFFCFITGLDSGMQYYFRAYAVNGNGTGYGDNISFRTAQNNPPDVKSGIITEDETWHTGSTIYLNGLVTVPNGVTLSIQRGCLVKAMEGDTSNSEYSGLLIARGGKIRARGTSDLPIIFTSVLDDISNEDIINGDYSSPNLGQSDYGLWLGLIIMGNAPISVNGNQTEEVWYGLHPSDPNNFYGGNSPDDNSGSLDFVSIRHAGARDFNIYAVGLGLGGVGAGTSISSVEVFASGTDAFGIYGGSVSCDHLIFVQPGDDGFDIDQGYEGTIDNFIGIAGPLSDHMMEIDGGESSLDYGTVTMRNGSLKLWNTGGFNGGEYADLRDGAKARLEGLHMFNGSEDSDFEIDDSASSQHYKFGFTEFISHEINTSHLSFGNVGVFDIYQDKSWTGGAFQTIPPDAIITTTPSVGADKFQFSDWTFAYELGELDEF